MGTEDDATALDNRPRQTYVFFPDRNAAVAQGWDVTWEGTVVSPRYSGILNGSTLKDGGGGFCSQGVLPGDIVTLRGCTTDADCPLGLACDRDQSLDQVPGGYKVTGLCMSKNLMAANKAACDPYAGSLRRYEIVKSSENGADAGAPPRRGRPFQPEAVSDHRHRLRRRDGHGGVAPAAEPG